jgi:hypothetical protein
MSQCVYKKGGPKKYYLSWDFETKMHFSLPRGIVSADGIITILGNRLYICTNYPWDGPSGPAIDTDNFMDGSLVHDALYDLMRQGLLSRWKYRRLADKEMRIQCKKDGMSFIRRWYTWGAVRIAGHSASGGSWFGLL